MSNLSFPPCSQNNNWVDAQSHIHWEECRGSLDWVLFNNSPGTVVDWGPHGAAIHRWQTLDSFPQAIRSPFHISTSWKDRALAPPQLRMMKPSQGPFQKTLWKVA